MITAINSEDRLVQQTFAEHLEKALGWKSIYVYNAEIFGLAGASERHVVLALDLRAVIARLILNIQDFARDSAIEDGPTARDLLRPRLMRGDIAV